MSEKKLCSKKALPESYKNKKNQRKNQRKKNDGVKAGGVSAHLSQSFLRVIAVAQKQCKTAKIKLIILLRLRLVWHEHLMLLIYVRGRY